MLLIDCVIWNEVKLVLSDFVWVKHSMEMVAEMSECVEDMKDYSRQERWNRFWNGLLKAGHSLDPFTYISIVDATLYSELGCCN